MSEPVVFAGIGIVSVAVGLPLAARRVPPNRWYGLRVPATFADENVWYEASAVTGRDLVAVGCVLLALVVALPLFQPSRVTYVAVCGGSFAVGSLVAIARGWRLAKRLTRQPPAGRIER